ncbi:hypothetical protein DPMN_164995 [Dreissena polymorpha]|uniref:Uncharacterized protein n=1 Tax=Dreissena polymorpha TaxID=45954 RepID=A0A9D4EYT7_DREPO|nr:hypothetical protein DPMN_164995 [Dreissena polymorpha]
MTRDKLIMMSGFASFSGITGASKLQESFNVTSQVRLFADDTAIYLTVTSEADCQRLQDDLRKLEKWE